MARVAAAGAPMVPAPGPLLPAAVTTIVPASAALLAITDVAPAGSPLGSPRDKLMTSATGFGIKGLVTLPLVVLPTSVNGDAASSIGHGRSPAHAAARA